jgi:hypothetical protein
VAKYLSPINSIEDCASGAAVSVNMSFALLAEFQAWARKEQREISVSVVQTRDMIRDTRQLLRQMGAAEKAL